jgi:hypothetical protein
MSAKRTLLREVNERIRELSRATDSYAVVCECGGPTCVSRVALPSQVYEELRGSRQRFVVAPGHEEPERVVATNDGYRIVTV